MVAAAAEVHAVVEAESSVPMPSPQDPVVPIPKPVPPSPVGPWPDIPTDDEDDSCKKAKAEVFDTCMGFYVRVTTRCGCQVFGAFSKPESGENTYDYPLDDGGTVHIVLSSTGGVSATVSYPDGSQEYYTVPPPSETTFVSESGPDSVRDADGNETIITRGRPTTPSPPPPVRPGVTITTAPAVTRV
jgi:hypothetical protein